MGFKPIDFETINDTTWRSRPELGGAVIDRIGSEFQSWAIYGWQGFHIGPREDKQPETESAKLFVHTDEEDGLAFGLYIECDGTKINPHWRNLRDGLTKDDRLQKTLAGVIENCDLIVGKYGGDEEHDPKWQFRSERGKLHRVNHDERTEATLVDMINEIVSLPNGEWVDLYFYMCMSKENALRAGASVVEIVSKSFLKLIPLYCRILYG